jgi:hypothetical protein
MPVFGQILPEFGLSGQIAWKDASNLQDSWFPFQPWRDKSEFQSLRMEEFFASC